MRPREVLEHCPPHGNSCAKSSAESYGAVWVKLWWLSFRGVTAGSPPTHTLHEPLLMTGHKGAIWTKQLYLNKLS